VPVRHCRKELSKQSRSHFFEKIEGNAQEGIGVRRSWTKSGAAVDKQQVVEKRGRRDDPTQKRVRYQRNNKWAEERAYKTVFQEPKKNHPYNANKPEGSKGKKKRNLANVQGGGIVHDKT